MANYTAPVKNNDVLNLPYTGAIDTIRVEKEGLYKFEVWGASGTNGNNNLVGGYGGYACYYAYCKAGDILYAVIGGYNNGYNGGGIGTHGIGGGASHIATRSGLLSSLASYIAYILCVAGGGGSAGYTYNDKVSQKGGNGGGTNGSHGSCDTYNYAGWIGECGYSNRGGGRIKYKYGMAVDTIGTDINGKFGAGGDKNSFPASGYTTNVSGAGAGLYGGGVGGYYNNVNPAGGGSGYIKSAITAYNGKSYTNATTASSHTGHGVGKVTAIDIKGADIFYNTSKIDVVKFALTEIAKIFYGSKEL